VAAPGADRMTTALIVEDDLRLRADLAFMLRDESFEVTALESAEEALDRLAMDGPLPDLLLLDVRLPGESGVDLVRRLVERDRLPPTIVISGEASINETVEALRLGVHDFLEKPFHRQRLMRSIRNTLEHAGLRRRVARLESELGVSTTMLGESPAMAELKEQIARVAPTDSRVLIRGESGSGKELVADALQAASARSDGPYIKLNCAAIPPQLVEDELFGHVRGAFTDARSDKAGLFEEAHQGTLFLDEIGDMGLELQSRLLRVLEDGRVRRVGSAKDRKVDVRVIAATHEDLEAAVGEKRFRQDLYYRLAHLPIDVPPLRRRGDDVRLLFERFLAVFCERGRRRRPRVDPSVLERLAAWSWPGNVRELRSLAERLAVLAGDPIDLDQLPEPYRGGEPDAAMSIDVGEDAEIVELREFRRRCEKRYIEAVLEKTGWNVSEAARLLGIHRSRLHQKMNELGTRRP
ncbi:MAG: sigma-54-dependent transcriptional regulator, partial [Thermoanaerobaculia bacterium]